MTDTESKTKYPTLLVELPSKGKLYSLESPLSEGEVELRYGSTEDENILMNPQYITRQIVFEKLLESLIVNKTIHINDLVTGDMNALIIAARRAMYGDEYQAKIVCTRCNEESEREIDLKSLHVFELNDTITENNFSGQSPVTNRTFQYHILSLHEEKELESSQKRRKKMKLGEETPITARLQQSIDAIDSVVDKSQLFPLIRSMSSIESLQLRKEMLSNTPDIDLSGDFICENCGYSSVVNIPIDVSFFWTTGRR